jgi:D-beta-D-heptose 7-phosphate kinase/D-beta-D-heptose 1-phosphate adenosyltransferase
MTIDIFQNKRSWLSRAPRHRFKLRFSSFSAIASPFKPISSYFETCLMKKVVVVSGGFDPIHVGHVRLIQEAAALGDELIVILNNDHWLRKKKGQPFMPEDQRREILESLKGVTRVVLTSHDPDVEDRSVCQELREIRPDIFAQGGDRDLKDAVDPNSSQNPEARLCSELGIEIVYGVGRGGKVQSSSCLTAHDRDTRECFCGSGEKYKECHGK